MTQKLQEIREDFDRAYTLYNKLKKTNENYVDLRRDIFNILAKYNWRLAGELPKWFMPVTPHLIFLEEYRARLETFNHMSKDEISRKGLADREEEIMERIRQSWFNGVSKDISALLLTIQKELKNPAGLLDQTYYFRKHPTELTVNKQSIEQLRKSMDSLAKFGLEYISQN